MIYFIMFSLHIIKVLFSYLSHKVILVLENIFCDSTITLSAKICSICVCVCNVKWQHTFVLKTHLSMKKCNYTYLNFLHNKISISICCLSLFHSFTHRYKKNTDNHIQVLLTKMQNPIRLFIFICVTKVYQRNFLANQCHLISHLIFILCNFWL